MPTATTVPVKMAQRRDTAANWTSANPTLLAGEIGIESDTNKIKLGTGSASWTALGYTPWSQVSTYPLVNADIASAAAIAYSKLATLTSGNIVLGSSANVATSTAVTGDVTISNTGVTAIASGVIVNADINASAAIVDTKLATIATAGKVSNSATTAASTNTASAIVARDASGNFTAGTITAALTGAASSNVLKAGDTMTGVLAVTAGTAALPAITPSGDPNTGIYSPGADQVAISTNGTGRVFVDSSGRVGVGVVNSSATLASATNRASVTYGLSIDTYNGASFENTFFAGFNGSVQSIGNFQNFPLAFSTNNTERARIDSSGRLLVGTSTTVTNGQGDARFQVTSNSSSYYAADFGHFSNDAFAGAVYFKKSRSTTAGGFDSVVANDFLGDIRFAGADGTTYIRAALIECRVDGTPGANDMPGRLVFSTTADGASSPTERLRITSAGVLQVADAGNITVGTTTGTKIGTATTQKIGFYNATPVVQPAAVANATTAVDVITQLNDLLAKLRTLGIIAT